MCIFPLAINWHSFDYCIPGIYSNLGCKETAMKVTTEGLTLGIISGLQRSGYKVEIEDGGSYANITKEALLSAIVSDPDGQGWGSMGEPLESL